MNREPPTLVSWDEVSLSLSETPPPLTLEGQRFVSRPGDLWVGATIMLGFGTLAGLCVMGAWTVFRWLGGLA